MASSSQTLGWNNGRVLFNGGLYLFWILVLSAGALIIFDQVLKSDTYPVKQVSFEGSFQHVTQAELEREVLRDLTSSFLTADLGQVKQRVESLPWVHRAWVSRKWPDTVHIKFIEQNFVARWGKDRWLNAEGIAVSLPGNEGPENLVNLNGPAGSEPRVLETYHRAQQQLDSIGLFIQALELTSRRMWKLTLTTGTELVIGRKLFDERIDRFVRVYPILKSQHRPLHRVDLRYANGLAVAWGTNHKPALLIREESDVEKR